VQRTGDDDVIDVPSVTGDEPDVFGTGDTLADEAMAGACG
jgi:hypothetical protein